MASDELPTTDDGPVRRAPGRPRDARRDAAILKAALEILLAEDYQSLTIEAVAARAGVGRPTIYRRWPSKAALVVAALVDSARLAIPQVDTGSLRGDLLAVQRHQIRLINAPMTRRVTAGLIADLATDPELSERYLSEYLVPRRDAIWEVLQRGIERGELDAGADLAFVHDLLIGPLFMRAVVWGQRLSSSAAAATTDVVLAAFGTGRRSPR